MNKTTKIKMGVSLPVLAFSLLAASMLPLKKKQAPLF